MKTFKMTIMIVALCLPTTFWLCGCATTQAYYNKPSDYTGFYSNNLSLLSLGMSKDQVRAVLGSPSSVRGMTTLEGGAVQEVWEYKQYSQDANSSVLSSYAYNTPVVQYKLDDIYWVTFIDGKLTTFGRPGDFGTASPPTKKYIIDVQQN